MSPKAFGPFSLIGLIILVRVLLHARILWLIWSQKSIWDGALDEKGEWGMQQKSSVNAFSQPQDTTR